MDKSTCKNVDLSTDVVCPFYHAEEGIRIKCEGFCKGVNIQLYFANKELMREHKRRHCMSIEGYPGCELYEVIYKQYEG